MPPGSSGSTRARPTLLIGLAAVLLVARVATGVYEAKHRLPAGGLVHWTPAAEAEALATATNKPILYDFSADWCQPCKRMEREVFADAAAAELINRSYVAVRVDDDDQSAAAATLREANRVEGLPTLVVRRPGAKPHNRVQGYDGKRQTMTFLQRSAAHPPDSGGADGIQ